MCAVSVGRGASDFDTAEKTMASVSAHALGAVGDNLFIT